MQKIIRRRQPRGQLGGGDDLHPLLKRIYQHRGLRSDRELDLSLSALLPVDQLMNSDLAGTLLADALAAQQRILVVGDFDADGATSCALAVSALREFGANDVGYLVPNRFDFGYGLTPEIVNLAAKSNPDLIITVDNGIASIEGVEAAREAGIATLVTDHHLPGDRLPEADVIVNPNQPGCPFSSKHLAGVGVIFYVMLALRAELRKRSWFGQHHIPEPNMGRYLDLVALGTVADVVPLDHNNRVLVNNGLRRMRAGQLRPGISALLTLANRDPRTLVAADLGYALGPRLNAAGRLDDISVGIECLLAPEPGQARRLANQLDAMNRDRRLIEKEMQEDAATELADLDLEGEFPCGLTFYRSNWHQGVVGILASRIKEKLHRPVIVFADSDDHLIKGSARSVEGLHIRDILDAISKRHPRLIERFGGHAMAAGLTLARDSYPAFQQAFADEAERHAADVELQAYIDSDGELSAEDHTLGMAEMLRLAGPWGQHFPEPIFDGTFELVNQRLVGERHLKLVLRHPVQTETLIDAIAFNIDPQLWPNEGLERADLAYRLDVNAFRGRRNLQLVVEQITPCAKHPGDH